MSYLNNNDDDDFDWRVKAIANKLQELKELSKVLVSKLQELERERDKRIDAVVGTSNPRRKLRIVSKCVKLVRLEAKGTITPDELVMLNTMEALDNYLDKLDVEHDRAKKWLENPNNTIEQIKAYNVSTDPNWTV